MDDHDDDGSREYNNKERDRRRVIRGVFFILAIIFCSLICSLVLDVILLSKKIRPIDIKIEHNLPDPSMADYGLYVDWISENEPHPRLLLNGVDTIPSDRRNTIGIRLGDMQNVEIYVPYGVAPGMHEGQLHIIKRSGSELLPDSSVVPISIEVAGSWLTNFRSTATDFFLLVGVAFLFYIIMILVNPKPYGWLIVQSSQSGIRRKIKLRMKKTAYLAPWKRGTLPLKHIWKINHIRPGMLSDGELRFFSGRTPPFLVINAERGGNILKSDISLWSEPRLDSREDPPARRANLMMENRGYSYSQKGRDDIVLFRFSKRL